MLHNLFDYLDLPNYENMMDALTSEFVSRVVHDAVHQIEEVDVINTDKDFLEYFKMLRKIVSDLKSLNVLEEITNVFMMRKIESKLPFKICNDWVKILFDEELLEKSSKERFLRFMTFMDFSSEVIQYLTAPIRYNGDFNYVTGTSTSVNSQKNFEKAALELRKLRGMIYRKVKRR